MPRCSTCEQKVSIYADGRAKPHINEMEGGGMCRGVGEKTYSPFRKWALVIGLIALAIGTGWLLSQIPGMLQ